MIIDLRCPYCDQPVIGSEPVVIRKKAPAIPDKCPNPDCGHHIKLAKGEDLTDFSVEKA